jgi:hypothetical protein
MTLGEQVALWMRMFERLQTQYMWNYTGFACGETEDAYWFELSWKVGKDTFRCKKYLLKKKWTSLSPSLREEMVWMMVEEEIESFLNTDNSLKGEQRFDFRMNCMS